MEMINSAQMEISYMGSEPCPRNRPIVQMPRLITQGDDNDRV